MTTLYGGTNADSVTSTSGELLPNRTIAIFDAKTDGERVEDTLTDPDGSALTGGAVTTDGNGVLSEFADPEDREALYGVGLNTAGAEVGERYRLIPANLLTKVAEAQTSAGAAATAAAAAQATATAAGTLAATKAAAADLVTERGRIDTLTEQSTAFVSRVAALTIDSTDAASGLPTQITETRANGDVAVTTFTVTAAGVYGTSSVVVNGGAPTVQTFTYAADGTTLVSVA